MLGFMVNRFYLVLAVLSILLCSSCTGGPHGQLVGKWVNKEGKDTIEFFKEGTVCIRDRDVEVCGTYRFVDDDRIRVRFESINEIEIFNIAISGNELTIFFSNGECSTFRRA